MQKYQPQQPATKKTRFSARLATSKKNTNHAEDSANSEGENENENENENSNCECGDSDAISGMVADSPSQPIAIPINKEQLAKIYNGTADESFVKSIINKALLKADPIGFVTKYCKEQGFSKKKTTQ